MAPIPALPATPEACAALIAAETEAEAEVKAEVEAEALAKVEADADAEVQAEAEALPVVKVALLAIQGCWRAC